MATLFRRNQLERIPVGADVRAAAGKRFAYWADEAGRVQKKEVVSTRTGDKVLMGRDAVWSGKIKLAKSRWKTVRLFTDKTASERRLVDLQKAADRGAAGCTTVETDRLGLPIAELAKQYIDSLRVQKCGAEHIRISEWMLKRLIDLGGWKQFADITTPAMEKVLDTLEADGATVSYRNKFIKRAKAFVAALVPDGWPNPLAKLKRINEKGATRTRERRAATAPETAAIFALELPEDRKLCYALAVYNGLRRNEIQSLRWSQLELDKPIPFVGLAQKMGEGTDYVPLHRYVLKQLRDRAAGMPSVRVVRSVPDMETMARDLVRAGIATKAESAGPGVITVAPGKYINIANEAGERLDFYALRHTFETGLDITGCSRATKKKLMRHAGEDVTDGYAHAELAEMLTALSRLPSPEEPVMTVAAMPLRMTGTDATKAHQMAHQNMGAKRPRVAATDANRKGGRVQNRSACPVRESGYHQEIDADRHESAGNGTSASDNPLSDNNLRPSTQAD